MNEKKIFIREYITEEECGYMCDNITFNCDFCSCFEDCYSKSCERCNSEFAKSINYGGYNTMETFLEQN